MVEVLAILAAVETMLTDMELWPYILTSAFVGAVFMFFRKAKRS